MIKHGLLILGALLASTSLLAMSTGCSDDNNSTGGSGGSSSSSSASSSGTGGMGGGSGGGGGSSAIDCNKYCTDLTKNCTGDNQQYADMASCMGVCAAIPAGMAGEQMGNSMECRLYHTSVTGGAPSTHCPHAGPSGADNCGSICESFCSIAKTVCPNEWAQEGECLTSCKAWTAETTPYNATNYTSGNTTQCRLYHLTVAASSSDLAMMHCPHTVESSTVCVP